MHPIHPGTFPEEGPSLMGRPFAAGNPSCIMGAEQNKHNREDFS